MKRSNHKIHSKSETINLDSIKIASQTSKDPGHLVGPGGQGSIRLLEKIGEGT